MLHLSFLYSPRSQFIHSCMWIKLCLSSFIGTFLYHMKYFTIAVSFWSNLRLQDYLPIQSFILLLKWFYYLVSLYGGIRYSVDSIF